MSEKEIQTLDEISKAVSGMTEAEKANNAEALVGKTDMSGFHALMNAAGGY